MQKAVALASARIEIDQIHWYVPHYGPSIQQRGKLSNQILSETPKELRNVERSVFMKELNNQNPWNVELCCHKNMKVPIWMNIGFQQRG